MTLAAMLADLPRACDVGAKRNAKGFSETWIGYKLHIDTADGEIPISCVLTAASVHDSQIAIPLATITAGRVTNLYDLMDSAYDVAAIKQHSRDLNHVPPIIDINPRATPGLETGTGGGGEAATPCRASHGGTSSLRRTQRGRTGQWRIKGQPRRANRAGAGTGQSDVPPDVRSSEFHGPATEYDSLRGTRSIIRAAPPTLCSHAGGRERYRLA